MAFRVSTTAQADREADAILEWLRTHEAGEAGIRWFLALNDAIESLSAFPERCPLAPENTRFSFEVRQLFYGRKPHVYRILFTIEDQTVFILHIRHGRRQPLTRGSLHEN
jgi:plasmid stabilization system protein ParE